MSITCQAVLLDIEGTTSSVRFVYDVLFPFARKHVESYLAQNWRKAAVRDAREQIANDAGGASFQTWSGNAKGAAAREKVVAEVHRLMDADVKATGLKQLQGLIWKDGFESGELRSHVYPDVPPALRRWKKAGKKLFIYSSGSIAAQKLFFAHTRKGDLLSLFDGHFDTTTGPKKEKKSYRAIARQMESRPRDIVFVSDVNAELDAADAAGMQTVLSLRPGNAPQDANGRLAVPSFAKLAID